MADVANPSSSAVIDGSPEKKKPEKPDEAQYQEIVKVAEKYYADAKAKFEEARARLDIAQPNKLKDSPAAKKRQDLTNQLNDIRKKLANGNAGRTQTFDQIKKLNEKVRSRIAEQIAARGRLSFKNVEEIDREIDRLEKQVNGGMMKIVDEKKALLEISNLRRQRKAFAGLDEMQKGIDETKGQITALKESLNDPEAKALKEKYDEVQTELDAVKAEQDDAYKGISTLRDQQKKLYAEQQEAYLAWKKISDDHFAQKKAFWAYENEVRQKAWERQKAEKEAIEKERKRERAEKLLAEARDPAYMDEIRRAESLLHYLDPTSITTAPNVPLLAPSGLSAVPQRTVDASNIKGTRVVRKDEREDTYFMGTGGKKSKKGRKSATSSLTASTPTTGKFSCPPSVMEDCSSMGINPPMSAADIATVTEKVKEKLARWKNDQKAQTERNVAKALKEIERLDVEDSSPGTPTTNGHAKKETAAVGEAVAKVGDTASKDAASESVASLSLEDKE